MHTVYRSIFFAGILSLLSGCGTYGGANNYADLVQNSNHPQVHRLYQAMAKYEKLSDKPWPQIPYNKVLYLGSKDSSVPLIRERLIELGELPAYEKSDSNVHDRSMVNAVRHFQWLHGLSVNGAINQSTIKQLNITPKERIYMMGESMKRWASIPVNANSKYIQVNIPAYKLDVYQGYTPILDMKVVVGEPGWKTPQLSSNIRTIVLNPTWKVPGEITEKEIVHDALKDPNYFKENNLKIYEHWHKGAKEIDPSTIDWGYYAGPAKLPYLIKQDAGDDNALGVVKFMFANDHDVYLHDTPAKEFFNHSMRALSHGCMRLEKPMALLYYLITHNTNKSMAEVYGYLASGKTKWLALNERMPLFVTYIPAWVGADGSLHIVPDVYGEMS